MTNEIKTVYKGDYCTECKSEIQSKEIHFHRGLKTMIRTMYYCNCKPRKYHGDMGAWSWQPIYELKIEGVAVELPPNPKG